jgi:hypothetical protein
MHEEGVAIDDLWALATPQLDKIQETGNPRSLSGKATEPVMCDLRPDGKTTTRNFAHMRPSRSGMMLALLVLRGVVR